MVIVFTPLAVLIIGFALSMTIFWRVKAANYPNLQVAILGLSVGLGILLGIYLLLLAKIFLSYSGNCPPNFMLGGDVNQPCSRIEHFTQEAGIILLMIIVYSPFLLGFLAVCVLAPLAWNNAFRKKGDLY